MALTQRLFLSALQEACNCPKFYEPCYLANFLPLNDPKLRYSDYIFESENKIQ